MRILVAAASFSPNISGIQRYAFNVVHCLLHAKEISAVHLVVSPWQQKLVSSAGFPADSRLTIHLTTHKPDSISRNLWYCNKLPGLAAQLDVDLVHLSYPVPIRPMRFTCPIIVTLHDLYPYEVPQNFGFFKVLFNRLILRHCLRRANAIVCVSEATKLQLKKFSSPRIWAKSSRVYNCVIPKLACTSSSPLPFPSSLPFLLNVAQHRYNKNIPMLIRVFSHMINSGLLANNSQLVIIGISGPETPKILNVISERNLRGRVHLLHGMSEEGLKWCYQNCVLLVTPSSTEGFGLAVAEAILEGCTVVCSDIPAHREIGGTFCSYVSLSGDPEKSLAAAILAALQRPTQAPMPLPQFSLEVLSKEYINLYRSLISTATPKQYRYSSAKLSTNISEGEHGLL
jgi:glycosyltransferase involved in cell wall biosynthesis